MNPEDLLRASRTVHLLAHKPGAEDSGQSWTLHLDGLHQVHIREAVKALRQNRQQRGETVSHPSLKPKGLQNAVVSALGMKSYDDWVTRGQQSLLQFLSVNEMRHPKDLITCQEGGPSLAESLTPQRIADRLFNSNLPLPKRLYPTKLSRCRGASGSARMA